MHIFSTAILAVFWSSLLGYPSIVIFPYISCLRTTGSAVYRIPTITFLDLLITQIKPTRSTATESIWNSRPSSGSDAEKNTSPNVPARGTAQVGHAPVATPSKTEAEEHAPPARAVTREEIASTIIMLIRSPVITSSERVAITYPRPNLSSQKPTELCVVVNTVVFVPAERRLSQYIA